MIDALTKPAPKAPTITTPDAPPTDRERLETELAYLELEAMANPDDYEAVKAALKAEVAQLDGESE